MFRSCVLLYAVCLFPSLVVTIDLNIDDTCPLDLTTSQQQQEQGKCMLLKDCSSALKDIKSGKNPSRCGFQGKEPIVCCKATPVGLKSMQQCNRTYDFGDAKVRFGGSMTSLASRLSLLSTQPSSEMTNNNTKIHIEPLLEVKPMDAPQNDSQSVPLPYPPPGIVGGDSARPKVHTHMAVLGYGDSTDILWACGGSLISEKFVLTAAHCIRSKSLNDVKFIRLGDLNLKETNDDAQPQDFTVKRTIVHPQYKPPSAYHDLALVELDREAEITPYVYPACLHVARHIDTSISWLAIGWGTTSFGGSSADHLQVVALNKVDHEVCRKIYETTNKRKLKNGIDDKTQLCAGDLNKDTCQGDSGGPLQIPNPFGGQHFEIIGITSFGKSCGIGSTPGVYTRVSYYIEWIESIVWPDVLN